MRDVPDELLSGPFTVNRARELGLSRGVLNGSRFVRVFPRVWRHRDHDLTVEEWVAAARMTLPAHALLTGITRIQQLGLDFGPRWPLRFVVAGPLHLAPDGIFLHRTRKLPPHDDRPVTPAAAFIAYCRRARVVDAIKVGDWLLRHKHMTLEELRSLALAELWRDGAPEALWILEHLDGRSRSPKESETRAVLSFAGLVGLEVNIAVDVGEDVVVIGDLVSVSCRVVVEYEGIHHQFDRQQYVADLDRYGLFRRGNVRYVQVTHEKLSRAKSLVGEVYRELLAGGYDGPAPEFGPRWDSLFHRITDVIGPRDDRPGRAVS